MAVYHISDTHLSFDDTGKVMKPMDERRWSRGSPNYQGYLYKIIQFSIDRITDNDIVIITGDIGHDLTTQSIIPSLEWLRKNVKGTIIIIRGNHDRDVNFATLRAMIHAERMYFIDENEIFSYGKYTFGCYSDHSTKTEQFNYNAYTTMAFNIVAQAGRRKTIPVFLSHYPVPTDLAEKIGNLGIKAYLSGHIHCTAADADVPGGVDWTWYNKLAEQTDDKLINGCFFSTGTTDVLLCKHKTIMKRIDALETPPLLDKIEAAPKGPEKQVLILVGLPGSGKSTFAKKLEAAGWIRVCQDDLGSRNACKNRMEDALRKGRKVVVDRCNFNVNQRKTWIELAQQHKIVNISALVFNIDPEVCKTRIVTRQGHPTIAPEEKNKGIVDKFVKDFVMPTPEEPFVRVDIVTDNAAAEVLESKYGVQPNS